MLTKLLNYFRTSVERVGDDNSANLTNDINEPVLSFVQCFKDDPKRFKVESYHEYMQVTGGRLASLTDKKINKIYTLGTPCLVATDHTDMTEVLTEKEICYIVDTLVDYYTKRAKRLTSLRQSRTKRTNVKIRKQLTEVYCNG